MHRFSSARFRGGRQAPGDVVPDACGTVSVVVHFVLCSRARKKPPLFPEGASVFPIAWESSSFRLASITLRRTRNYAPRHNGGGVEIADVCDEERHVNLETPFSFRMDNALDRRNCQHSWHESCRCITSAPVMYARVSSNR